MSRASSIALTMLTETLCSREPPPTEKTISASFALNVYLIFGVRGSGPPELVTTAIGIDPGVVLGAINCALLVWFGSVLARACAQEADGREACARIPA